MRQALGAATGEHQRQRPIAARLAADGATVNAETATITGKTQGKSTVVARNEANGTSATATADPELEPPETSPPPKTLSGAP